MSFLHHKKATPRQDTGPIIVPDDIDQARAVGEAAEVARVETLESSYRQQSWFERSVAPMLEELRSRREQNGFGQEFELSIMPRTGDKHA